MPVNGSLTGLLAAHAISTAESVNRSLFLKNLEKHFCNLTYMKTNLVKHMKIYRNIYRKNLSAIVYRLPISLQEIESGETLFSRNLSTSNLLVSGVYVIVIGCMDRKSS